eukprot:1149081-Pelagomonas_calceolata.AAC.6
MRVSSAKLHTLAWRCTPASSASITAAPLWHFLAPMGTLVCMQSWFPHQNVVLSGSSSATDIRWNPERMSILVKNLWLAKFFAKIGMRSGFHQKPVAEEDWPTRTPSQEYACAATICGM